MATLEKAFNTIANSKELTEQSISCLTFILSVLISQGCAYIKTFEADLPKTVGNHAHNGRGNRNSHKYDRRPKACRRDNGRDERI